MCLNAFCEKYIRKDGNKYFIMDIKRKLVISKNPALGQRRFLAEIEVCPSKDEGLTSTYTTTIPMLQTERRIPFMDWYEAHYEHVQSIRKFVVERLSNNPYITFSMKLSSDDVLAEFLYRTSSCANKRYKFFK